ncbi:MAG: hypothetical protein RBU30_04485 [Polyangia bacterium]|jgi:hypothetical protein|nr:hypothetical protein [Polyangia bacterium]
MELVALAIIGVGAGVGIGVMLLQRRRAQRAWEGIARRLELVVESTPESGGMLLWGLRRGVPVRIRVPQGGDPKVAALFSVDLPPGLVVIPRGQRWPEVSPKEARDYLMGLSICTPGRQGARMVALVSHSVVRASLERLLERRSPFAMTSEALFLGLPAGTLEPEVIESNVEGLIEEVLRIESGLAFQMPTARDRRSTKGEANPRGEGEGPQSEEPQGARASSDAEEPLAAGPDALRRGEGTPDEEVLARDEPPQSVVQLLVSELAREGALDSEGEFTLSRAEAREKMLRFQMEDPQSFALLLAGAALLRGATRVQIELGRNFEMIFDGQPFFRGEVDRIWSSLFTSKGAEAERSLRYLALGLHGALGGLCDEARILSGSGPEGLEWRIYAKGKGEEACLPLREERPEGGTEVSLRKLRWKSGDKVSLWLLLHERLSHASASITLDGTTLSGKGLRPTNAMGVVSLPGGLGAMGFVHDQKQQGQIRAVVNGLLVESVTRKSLLPYLVAVATHPALETDLSLGRVVRNAAWEELVELVVQHQAEALRAFTEEAFGRLGGPGGDLEQAPEAAAVARACLGHAFEGAGEQGRARSGGPADPSGASGKGFDAASSIPPDLVERLGELPLYPVVTGGAVSLAEISRWTEEQPILLYSSLSVERACLEPDEVREAVGDPSRVLSLAWPMRSLEGRPLVDLFQGRVRDVGQTLRRRDRSEVRLRDRLYQA